MSSFFKILIGFLLVIPFTGSAEKKPVFIIQGTVSSAESNEPLPGANVIVTGTVFGTITDTEGRFVLDRIPAGSFQIKATMMGYKPQTLTVDVTAGQQPRLTFKLAETVIETPALVVTASKRRQSIQDSPSSLAVVTAKDMERLNEATLDQALRNAPGLHFSVQNVNIRGSSGFSRGAGSRVLLLVDGIPMMPGDSGDIKWDVIPTSQVKQVEIVKGAGSALYGSYALGGIINVITNEPGDKNETSFRLATGIHDKPHWEEWRWTDRTLHFSQVDLSHSHNWKKVNLLLSVNRRQDTGFSQNAHSENWGALGKFRYSFSPQTYLVLNGRWTSRKAGEIILWRNQHDALTVPPESIGEGTQSNKVNLNAIFRKVVTPKLAYKLQTAYLRNHWSTVFPDHTDESTGNNWRTEAQFDLSPTEKNSVTFGNEIIVDQVEASIFGDHNAWGWALYLQDEYRIFKPFSITAGLRYDLFQIDQDITDHEWSPKLGLVYRPGALTSLRASAGHGFRAPTMAEMFTSTVVSGFRVVPNPDLTAERSWSYEMGLNQVLGQNMLLDLAFFSTDYWNLIEGQPDETNTIQFDNLTRARISGAEISLRTSWWQRILGFDVSYTFMEPRDLTLEKMLAYRPQHLLTTSLSVNIGPVGLNADYRYASRIDEVLIYPEDDRVAQKLADVRLSYDWYNYQFSFDVDNIFNYNYVPVERNIAPIRKFMLTLSGKF